MSEAFEIGVTLALSDGVSAGMVQARNEMAQLERVLQTGGVSVQQLRAASTAALFAIRSVPRSETVAAREPAAARPDEGVPAVRRPEIAQSIEPGRLEGPGLGDLAKKAVVPPGPAVPPVQAPVAGVSVPQVSPPVRAEVQVPAAAVSPAPAPAPSRVDVQAPSAAAPSSIAAAPDRLNVLAAKPEISTAAAAPVAEQHRPLDGPVAVAAAPTILRVSAPVAVIQAKSADRDGNQAVELPTPKQPQAPVGLPARFNAAATPQEMPAPDATAAPTMAPRIWHVAQTVARPEPAARPSAWFEPMGQAAGAPPSSAAAALPRSSGVTAQTSADAQDEGTDAPAAQSPAAPPAQQASSMPTEGDVFLDGALVGRWMSRFLTQQAGRASAGPTGFDPRRGRLLPGATVGS